MKTIKRLMSVGSVLLASTMLAACSADLDEVQGWMNQTRANTPRRVGKLDEPKNFVSFRYEARPVFALFFALLPESGSHLRAFSALKSCGATLGLAG